MLSRILQHERNGGDGRVGVDVLKRSFGKSNHNQRPYYPQRSFREQEGGLRMSQEQRGINDFYPQEPFSPRRDKPNINMYGNLRDNGLRDSFQNAGMNMLSPTRKEENKLGGAGFLSKAA